jgi:hypothetical protein
MYINIEFQMQHKIIIIFMRTTKQTKKIKYAKYFVC